MINELFHKTCAIFTSGMDMNGQIKTYYDNTYTLDCFENIHNLALIMMTSGTCFVHCLSTTLGKLIFAGETAKPVHAQASMQGNLLTIYKIDFKL